MKRYCVVIQEGYPGHLSNEEPTVEFYWAESFDHAKEQAENANPGDYRVLTVVRDPESQERKQ